jgi:cytidylate kinase
VEDPIMTFKPTSQLLGEAMEQARSRWRQLKNEPLDLPMPKPEPKLTIAISRECGAEGSAMAVALGERLNWSVYDRSLLEKIAEDAQVSSELLESADEKHNPWLLGCLQGFLSGPTAADRYIAHLSKVIGAVGAHGNCLIVGRGAHILLPQQTTIRVRLVAPRTVRIARIRERLDLSRPEAERHVTKVDRERAHFVKKHFQKDASDAGIYDIVLNTGSFTIEQCMDLIVQAVDQRKGEVAAKLEKEKAHQ